MCLRASNAESVRWLGRTKNVIALGGGLDVLGNAGALSSAIPHPRVSEGRIIEVNHIFRADGRSQTPSPCPLFRPPFPSRIAHLVATPQTEVTRVAHPQLHHLGGVGRVRAVARAPYLGSLERRLHDRDRFVPLTRNGSGDGVKGGLTSMGVKKSCATVTLMGERNLVRGGYRGL